MTQYGQWYGPPQYPGGWQPATYEAPEPEEWKPEGNATDGMNFFRDEREYDHYKNAIATPATAFKRLYKASKRAGSESKGKAKEWLKDKASKAGGAIGDLFYQIKNSGPHSQQYFFDDDHVITSRYSNTMNELNKTINAVRFSMYKDRNFSALDGFDAAVRMFAEAAQQKKEEKKAEKKQSFWQKNKGKILTAAGALALAGGAGYAGFKVGQKSEAEKLQEQIEELTKAKDAAFASGKKAEAARLGKQIKTLQGQLNWALEMAKKDPNWYQKKQQKNVMSQVDERAKSTDPFKNDSWANATSGKGTLG